jgi:hypothetical protein
VQGIIISFSSKIMAYSDDTTNACEFFHSKFNNNFYYQEVVKNLELLKNVFIDFAHKII